MENKLKYHVIVLRHNQDHIFLAELDNYDAALNLWTETKNKWGEAIKAKLPFELTSPLVTAFDPGMIYEITIKAAEATTNVNSNNPYKRTMQERGFSNTLTNPILDGGYQR